MTNREYYNLAILSWDGMCSKNCPAYNYCNLPTVENVSCGKTLLDWMDKPYIPSPEKMSKQEFANRFGVFVGEDADGGIFYFVHKPILNDGGWSAKDDLYGDITAIIKSSEYDKWDILIEPNL
jgi:hypothetical protein